MNARIVTVTPDHPLHPIQVTARNRDASWLRRVRSAGTFELLQMRGAHLRTRGEHCEDSCWMCCAIGRAFARKVAK